METIIDRSTLEELRASLRGATYALGEEVYDEARKAWMVADEKGIATFEGGPRSPTSGIQKSTKFAPPRSVPGADDYRVRQLAPLDGLAV